VTVLAGKTVWITGASGGIGEALAVHAVRSGARLLLSARRQTELERVRAAAVDPDRVSILPLDLLDFDAVEAARQAERLAGPIDILVNNAGQTQRGSALDTEMKVYRQLMELDFFAPVALTRAVLPGMIQRGGGHVVMVGSVVSRFGAPLRSGYSAAKHALAGYTESARADLWRSQVRFTLACPGYVRTQISINALTATGESHGHMDKGQKNGMSADRCASRIWAAVEKNEEEVLIGAEAKLVHLKRYFPGLFSAALKRAKPN
jgi:short-subunit dehydrogenase